MEGIPLPPWLTTSGANQWGEWADVALKQQRLQEGPEREKAMRANTQGQVLDNVQKRQQMDEWNKFQEAIIKLQQEMQRIDSEPVGAAQQSRRYLPWLGDINTDFKPIS